MKIRELIIKNFGKFSNQDILLDDGINIYMGRMSQEIHAACFYQRDAVWHGKRTGKGFP